MKIKRLEADGLRLLVFCEINGQEYEFGTTVYDTEALNHAANSIYAAFERARKQCGNSSSAS